ncbi:MAG TPA: glycosyltransferase family 4 protein [Methylibium sp.]|uniref:glycosyltransferase family 4 protein n=1 Tax=Methylibium sp. TaxID=2067992 RepID=UPI002DBBCEA7|nr:glycosyltransferase family 4 protein [Methylibium sp.]HEU4459922.1 glycosyltransferase family 4 protein [Methylibium sp.]
MNLALTANGKFYTFDLARALQAQGVQAEVFTSYPRFKLRGEELPAERIHTFPWLHAPYMALRRRDMLGLRAVRRWEWEAKTRFDRHVARNLPQLLDVLVGMSGSSLESGRAAQARGARYVCDRASAHIRTQDRILREEFERWGLRFDGIDPRVIEREEAEYAQADAVAVPSGFVVRSFAEQGVPAHKVHRLRLGVDLSRYRATAAPDPERFDVLCVAAFSLQKGVPYLIESYKKLQHPAKSLSFAGAIDPALVDHLKRRGTWADDAQLLGHLPLPRLVDRMSRSHLLVLPSVQEGLAMVQAQAMACGCPVIGTTHSGAEELFDDGVEGFIVPARDGDALTERLQWMADHPEERAAMGRLALERVRSLGGWREYGAQALALYRRLAASRSTAAPVGAPGLAA